LNAKGMLSSAADGSRSHDVVADLQQLERTGPQLRDHLGVAAEQAARKQLDLDLSAGAVLDALDRIGPSATFIGCVSVWSFASL